MPHAIWKRLGQLTLQQAPCATLFTDPVATARDLEAAFTVLDVGPYGGRSDGTAPFSLRSATVAHGEVVISTFAGTPLHSHLRSEAMAFLVLPGCGIGHYRLLGERMNVTAGECLGYLPPCEFAVTNSETGGTLIGFSLASLQRRIAAIGGDAEEACTPDPELLRPAAFSLNTPEQVFLVHTILNMLQLIDQAARLGCGPPPAVLALDDVILRSTAMLLRAAQPAAPAEPPLAPAALESSPSLDRAVDLAMSWMLAHLDRPISLTDIELQVGYGRRALQLGFRKRVGCGPIQWLRRQRLDAAHALLLAAGSGGPQAEVGGAPVSLSVAEAGRRCGYFNLSQFSRDFAARFGLPPSRLLRQRR